MISIEKIINKRIEDIFNNDFTNNEKEELLYALDIIIRLIPQSYFVKYEKQEIINELKIIGNYFYNGTLDVKEHKHHIRFTNIIKDRINYHINLLDILYK
jgi:hypothetical protein